jgi:polar amino acid transport system ATP-binding protein
MTETAANSAAQVSADEVIVEAKNVHKYFGNLHVLRGMDLHVEQSEVVVLIGPSGSGKSTFLRCLNRLEKIDEGRITVCGQLMGFTEENGNMVELSESKIAKHSWGSLRKKRPIRASCRVANSSGWQLREPWRWIPR